MDSSFSSPLHWSSMSPLPEERTPLLHPPWHCARQRTPPAVHRRTGVAAVHPQGAHATASPAQHIPAICGRPWPRTRGRGGIHGRRNTGGAPRSDGGSPRPRRKARRTAPLRVDAQEAAAHPHRVISGPQQGLTGGGDAGRRRPGGARTARRWRPRHTPATAAAAAHSPGGGGASGRRTGATAVLGRGTRCRRRRQGAPAAAQTGGGGGGAPHRSRRRRRALPFSRAERTTWPPRPLVGRRA